MSEQPINPLETAPNQTESDEQREQRADDYVNKNVEPEDWREQE